MYPDLALKEDAVHGTKKNPLMSIHFTTGIGTSYPDGFFVKQHWHPNVEIILIRKGSYSCELDLEAHHLQEGDMVIINSQQLHQLKGQGQDTAHDVLLFNPDILDFSYDDEWQETWIRPFLKQELVFKNIFSPLEPGYAGFRAFFDEILKQSLEKTESWYIRCKLLLLQMFALATENRLLLPADQEHPKAEQRKIEHYKMIIAYMQEHFHEPVSLRRLADVIPCNPQYLCRFFKEISGVSPIQHLIGYRIEQASHLLARTSLPILQIALDCGFENASYFIRKFKEIKGCTPKEFREKAAAPIYQERNTPIMSLSSIQIIAADPAGNKTIFVLTPVARKHYQKIASYLLSLKEFGAEQVAFVLPDVPNDPSIHGRMEMCGLEFCGNASRTFALIQAKKLGLSGHHTIRVQVSGCEKPLDVEVDTDTNDTKIQMPTPLSITTWKNDILVDLGGILHLVTTNKDPEPAVFESLKEQLVKEYDPPALGVMFFQPENRSLTPVVYVADVQTTYFEGSCASGTVAVIAALTHACPSGDYSYVIRQPQGELTASIQKGKEEINSVFIQGPVTVEHPVAIQLPPGMEI